MDKSRIIFGDCRVALQKLIKENIRVQCVVTSPPYFALRSYLKDDHIDKFKEFGSEHTPEKYVENLVVIFRLIWDVLEDDGTVWLNLGDSYYGSWGATSHKMDGKAKRVGANTRPATSYKHPYLKPKDLIGIPWRVALALQMDGWWLRQDVIWAKPNCLPESVTDRCTKSHEYIFLLTKNKKYYYNADAIKEPTVTKDSNVRNRNITRLNNTPGRSKMGGLKTNSYDFKNKRDVWWISPKPYKGSHFATFPPDLVRPCVLAGSKKGDFILDPFAGSGTVGQVAKELDRKFILLELNKEYRSLIYQRIGKK